MSEEQGESTNRGDFVDETIAGAGRMLNLASLNVHVNSDPVHSPSTSRRAETGAAQEKALELDGTSLTFNSQRQRFLIFLIKAFSGTSESLAAHPLSSTSNSQLSPSLEQNHSPSPDSEPIIPEYQALEADAHFPAEDVQGNSDAEMQLVSSLDIQRLANGQILSSNEMNDAVESYARKVGDSAFSEYQAHQEGEGRLKFSMLCYLPFLLL
jgi:hypothetical protein